MRAILNISLDEQICPGYAVDHRFRMVMAAMRLCFRDVAGEIASVRYAGPDGQVRTECAVVVVDCDTTRPVFEAAVFHLAQSFGQDCIAVLFADDSGLCIGPRADRWPFERKNFNLAGVCQMQGQAA